MILRYLCAQPAIDYYTWQVELVINNFMKHGINPNHIDIVCSIKDNQIPDRWLKLAAHYNYVRFFFYNDERDNPCYISSIRPHILEKHFKQYPELSHDAIMYHDCDIILTKRPDWDHLIEDDVWYLSDTNSYINATYIKSKKFGVYERMCEIVGIDEAIPQANDQHGGGAQYLMKNVDAAFWNKVYHDSEKLYQFFSDHLKVFPEGCLGGYHPIQGWTADMWAVLWNAWYFKHETKVVPDLEFVWPMNPIEQWDKHTIFHNAGVIPDSAKSLRLFYKGEYVNGMLPYDLSLANYNETLCSYNYVKEIIETAKRSCLL